MAGGHLQTVLRQMVRTLAPGAPGGVSDAQLLERFIADRDEAAFELLVWRHQRMVLGVCRRVLGDLHDAEDAFQAAFLILARKAPSISRRASLASWLYKVAYRAAVRVRASRPVRTPRVDDLALADDRNDFAGVEWRDIAPVLDEEVYRLPEKYCVPFVLCYLQGKTYDEVSGALGLPKGTVSSRLTKARELLRTRLAARGLGLSGGLFASALCGGAASAAAPAELVRATVQAVAGACGVPVNVVAVTEGVLRSMFLTKLKTAVPVLLLVAALGVGAGGLFYRTQAAESPPPGKEPSPPPRRTGDPTKPPDVQRMMQGTWKVVEAQANGKHSPLETDTNQRWVVAGDTITVHYSDGSTYPMTFRLGGTGQPNAIDLAPTEREKGSVYKGIYQLEGDSLKVRYTRNVHPTAQRPANFDPGSGEFSKDRGARLFVLRRVREKEKGGGAKEDRTGLLGTWKSDDTDPLQGKARWTFREGGAVEIDSLKGTEVRAWYRANPAARPATIEVTHQVGTDGPLLTVQHGIYELTGPNRDRLRIYLVGSNKPRPAEFPRLPALGQILAFRRERPAEKDADPTKPPIPGAVPLKFDEPITINAKSNPIKHGGQEFSIISIGRGTFHLSKEGHLTAKLKAAVVQYAKVDYWIYAAVFDIKGQLLGTASHKEEVTYTRLGATPTRLREIELDFGISNAFRRAAYVVVTIGERDVPKP